MTASLLAPAFPNDLSRLRPAGEGRSWGRKRDLLGGGVTHSKRGAFEGTFHCFVLVFFFNCLPSASRSGPPLPNGLTPHGLQPSRSILRHYALLPEGGTGVAVAGAGGSPSALPPAGSRRAAPGARPPFVTGAVPGAVLTGASADCC